MGQLRYPYLNLYVLAALILLSPTVTGHDPDDPDKPDKNLHSYYHPPDDIGLLTYTWRTTEKGPEVFFISYSGSPEWLVEQKDPRSHWHKISTLEKIELNSAGTLTPEEMKYIASLKGVTDLTITETEFYRGAFAPLEK